MKKAISSAVFFEDETGEKLYAAVQKAVDGARAESAQSVIIMTHLGNEDEYKPCTYADVIASTTVINAMLDGHSDDTDHVEMLNKDGETVLRQGCGNRLSEDRSRGRRDGRGRYALELRGF